MIAHCTFHIDAWTTPAVLPRVLLVFSRRRLRVRALQVVDLDDTRPAEIQIDVDCERATATDVAKQLRRVVEVVDASLVVQEPASASVSRRLDAA